jgi:hypothetical protein
MEGRNVGFYNSVPALTKEWAAPRCPFSRNASGDTSVRVQKCKKPHHAHAETRTDLVFAERRGFLCQRLYGSFIRGSRGRARARLLIRAVSQRRDRPGRGVVLRAVMEFRDCEGPKRSRNQKRAPANSACADLRLESFSGHSGTSFRS